MIYFLDAKQLDDKTNIYFNGKPCKYGHISGRYKSTYVCVECAVIHSKKQKIINKTFDLEGFVKNKSKYFIKYIEDRCIPVTESGCWLWLKSKNRQGYGVAAVNSKYIKAHRLSYIVYKGLIKKGMFVCHSCDMTSCVNPDHLWLGTVTDNVHDMHKKGRFISKIHELDRSGSKNPKAKLTEILIKDIKEKLIEGLSQRKIAKEFKVSQSTINYINRNKTWRHV